MLSAKPSMAAPGALLIAEPICHAPAHQVQGYLTYKKTPLGPYRRPIPRVLGGSWGGGSLLSAKPSMAAPGALLIAEPICHTEAHQAQGYLLMRKRLPLGSYRSPTVGLCLGS